MTNLSLEILFWTILIAYLGLRLNQTWNGYKKQYQKKDKMKLQTQFTVPNKDLRDFDFLRKMQTLEKTLKQSCRDYPSAEDCLVCCN